MLQAGDMAPDFDLPALVAGVKKRFRLSEHQGKRNIVLMFYPFNWEIVSGEQLVAYQVDREKFLAHDTDIVAISVESIMNTTAWEREIGPFDYALCSDFWPHGDVSWRYGVLGDDGASQRAIFVIGKNGCVEFEKVYPVNEVPTGAEILEVLSKLSSAA